MTSYRYMCATPYSDTIETWAVSCCSTPDLTDGGRKKKAYWCSHVVLYLTRRYSTIFCLRKTSHSNHGAISKRCWARLKLQSLPAPMMQEFYIYSVNSFLFFFTFGFSSPFLFSRLITRPSDHRRRISVSVHVLAIVCVWLCRHVGQRRAVMYP